MRVALALPLSHAVIAEVIRERIPDAEILREMPYVNRNVLEQFLKDRPEIVIVADDVSADEDLTLEQFIFRLRQGDIRVIFLAGDRKPGDPLLSDLVAMGVTDLVVGGQVSVETLIRMLHQPTPWSEASRYIIPGRRFKIESPFAEEEKEEEPEAQEKQAHDHERDGTAGERPAPAPAVPVKRVTAVIGLGPEGTGVTTVAITLASLWAQAHPKTALVDLDPVNPSVGTHLTIPPDYSALKEQALTERAIDAAVQTHGIFVYNSPVFPDEPFASRMTEVHVVRLLDRLRPDHDRIIVDAGHRIDHAAVRTLLQMADEVFVVLDLDPHRTLVAARRWPVLTNMTSPEKCRFIINRSGQTRHMNASRVLSAFEDPPEVAAELPLVPEAPDASFKGEPLDRHLGAEHAYVKAFRGIVEPAPKRGFRLPWRR